MGYERQLSLEQLEEMDLLTIGFQLPPIVKFNFNIDDGEVALNGTCVPNTHLLYGEVVLNGTCVPNTHLLFGEVVLNGTCVPNTHLLYGEVA